MLNDMFASLVMSDAMRSTLDFSMVVGIKSTGDDLAGSKRISLSTSPALPADTNHVSAVVDDETPKHWTDTT